jgi:predicted RNA-binding Zn-ribbon protein involved in translation (DUF1610 family)
MMHCTEFEKLKARKKHVCMSCGQQINEGENYVRWRCYIDGDASTTKMHHECYDMHNEVSGQWDYSPYSYERPNEKINQPAMRVESEMK